MARKKSESVEEARIADREQSQKQFEAQQAQAAAEAEKNRQAQAAEAEKNREFEKEQAEKEREAAKEEKKKDRTWQTASTLVSNGIMSINEARQFFGLNPKEGCDDLFIPYTDINQNKVNQNLLSTIASKRLLWVL